MLERLDTLIAFATVLLGVSLLITILNQMIASLLGYRATYLKDGIKDLLETLDPELADKAAKITDRVLTHKLVSDSIFAHKEWAPLRWRLASSIRAEELAKVMSLISKGEPYAGRIEGILKEINPTLLHHAEMINKIAPGAIASSDQLLKDLSKKTTNALGRLEAAFNSTMDRVRQRFTLQMRIWTVIFSVIFAFVYHMDAGKIYSELAMDPAVRASVSSVSGDLMKTYTELTATQAAGAKQGEENNTESEPQQNLDKRSARLSQAYGQVRDKLSDFNLALFEVPQPWYRWKGSEIFGILVMAAFLSLGAPFWYNTLKNLVNLRSQVAQKQQEESGG